MNPYRTDFTALPDAHAVIGEKLRAFTREIDRKLAELPDATTYLVAPSEAIAREWVAMGYGGKASPIFVMNVLPGCEPTR